MVATLTATHDSAHDRPVSSALRRFGILECIPCGEPHEFVSYDAAVMHITDAMCCECGFVYGRRDDVDLGTPPLADDPRASPMLRRERHRVPVISDGEAAAALRRLQRRHPGKADTKAETALRDRMQAALVGSAAAPAPAAEGASLRSPPSAAPAGLVADSVAPSPAGPQQDDPLASLLDVEDDGSRRAAFLRSLRSWQSPKPP